MERLVASDKRPVRRIDYRRGRRECAQNEKAPKPEPRDSEEGLGRGYWFFSTTLLAGFPLGYASLDFARDLRFATTG